MESGNTQSVRDARAILKKRHPSPKEQCVGNSPELEELTFTLEIEVKCKVVKDTDGKKILVATRRNQPKRA